MSSIQSTNAYSSIFVDRGPTGGNMTTDALAYVVTNKKLYKIGQRGLEESLGSLYAVDLDYRSFHPWKIEKPLCLEIEAEWDKFARESGAGNNILGDNGLLFLPAATIVVPCVEATEETLAYYGAVLLRKGDVIQFPDQEYPIFQMTVGPRYIEKFLMTDQGGGFYLEYHYDKPHFHMPIQGGGYYLLAKWNDEKTKLQITAFKIRDGDAVYTKKGAIHCDAALTGKLLVGYDKAEDCSTVLLRTKDHKKTQLQFYDGSIRSKL